MSVTSSKRAKRNREIQRERGVDSTISAETALIRSAKNLFSKFEYDGVSVKQIADLAGVNIALISYYFGGKEELYRKCFEGVGQRRVQSTERILVSANSLEEFKIRVHLFSDEVIQVYLDDPEVETMIQKECDSGIPRVATFFQKTYQKSFLGLVSFLEDAKTKGFIRNDLDAFMTATLLMGMIRHWTRRNDFFRKTWNLSLEKPESRKKIVDHIVQIFLRGALT